MNLIWLFAFNYRLPPFRFPSAGEEIRFPEDGEKEEMPYTGALVSEASARDMNGQEDGTETADAEENLQEAAKDADGESRNCRVAKGYITTLRRGPGTNYEVIGSASEEEILTVTGPEEEGWLPVRSMDGLEAYVFADYVIMQE